MNEGNITSEKMKYDTEMIERLINSHSSLFRTLNRLNNTALHSNYIEKALKEAKELNAYFADIDSPKIIKSEKQ